MYGKLLLVVIAIVAVVQMNDAASLRERRDTVQDQISDKASDAEKTIDSTLQEWKKDIGNFFEEGFQVKKEFRGQMESLMKTVKENLKGLGDKISDAGKSFADTVQEKTSELVKTDK